MRDIYKTAKQAQMAPVRGRVKAMMAQPRAIPQARKIARQTTGFKKGGVTSKKKMSTDLAYVISEYQKLLNKGSKRQKAIDEIIGRIKTVPITEKQEGGHVKKVSHDSELTKWFLEKHGGTKKKKPHSTQEGRIAAGKRALWRGVKEKEKRQQMGPGAPARRKEAGMYVKKGGVMNYKKGGATPEARGSAKSREHRARIRRLAERVRDKDRPSQRDIKRAGQLFKVIDWADHADDKKVLLKKKGGKVDKKWIQKAVNPKHKGYCTPMTKKTCTPRRKALARTFKKKAKKGWANGGTVVMPTVGNDVRTRAYKQGALISPRPRPTTLAHGRMRGVGIAKRGW